MKKNKLLNILMIALIGVALIGGIMYVGSLKGWFSEKGEESLLSCEELTGTVRMERAGVGYSFQESTAIKDGDILESLAASKLKLKTKYGALIVLGENSEAIVSVNESGTLSIKLNRGEMFVDASSSGKDHEVVFSGGILSAKGAVFSVDSHTGSANVNVYSGEVELNTPEKEDYSAESENTMQVLINGEGKVNVEVNKLTAASLNDFNIAQAIDSGSKLCFSSEELKKVLDDRQKEIAAAQAEKAAADAALLAQGGNVAVETSSTQSSNTSSSGGSGLASEEGKSILTCTITIRCDTILDNMGNLTSGKGAYVPSNGCILATSAVEFYEGETVFEVLKRTCDSAGIQLEYSWTPMYNSYYIEGINNLYEFDCGNESGWMYKVNGWFPNYGCSSYTLKGGDVIVWCYTCNGLGADVGGGVY